MRLVALALAVAAAASADGLSPAERAGRKIYRKGEDGTTPIGAVLRNTGMELPGTSFPCVNCHGESAEGLSEGGVEAPSIAWRTLDWSEETVRRAITAGIGPGNSRLHAAMPSYRMSPAQMSSLLAYLKVVGAATDGEPGISADRIRVGCVLPLSGPQSAAGREIASAIANTIAAANRQGGIYGRELELVVEDSGPDRGGITAAARRLIARDVFAAIGNPDSDDSGAGVFQDAEVPLIGPASLMPESVAPDSYVLYLLPGAYERSRVLADYAFSQTGGSAPRLAIVASSAANGNAAATAVEAEARVRGFPAPYRWVYTAGKFEAGDAAAALRRANPNSILFFGGLVEFGALGRSLLESGWTPTLLMSEAPGVAGPKSLATAAGMVLIEAMRMAGRKLTHRTLLECARRIHDFPTPGLPPISFGPKGAGIKGASVIGFDWITSGPSRLSPFWVAPEN